MKKQEILDLLSKSDQEIKDVLNSKNISISEFSKNMEDLKLSALIDKNSDLFDKLSVLKTNIIDFVYQDRFKPKVCNESKFRKALQGMFLIFLVSLGLISCKGETKNACVKDSEIAVINDTPIYEYIIDSCEYMGNLDLSRGKSILVHKGNCKFCKNRNK